jgi:hypothetical protein
MHITEMFAGIAISGFSKSFTVTVPGFPLP